MRKQTTMLDHKPNAYLNYVSYLLASNEISNAQLSTRFPAYSEQYITDSTGVSRRYSTDKGQLSSDFGTSCGEDFFNRFPVAKNEIDFLIFCTEVPDYTSPATSCIIQHKLGLPTSIGTLDLTFGCSGYTYGLSMAKALVESSVAHNVLFITADIPSWTIPPNAPALHFLFSDGASASLISSKPVGQSIGHFSFGTDGSGERAIMLRNSGFREQKTKEWFEDPLNTGLQLGRMEMDGEAVFHFVLNTVPQLVEEILKRNDCTAEDIDLYVFHQASAIILKSLKRKLGIPNEKLFSNLSDVGNTLSSTIPIAYAAAIEQGKIRPGMKILFAGFGVGYSWSGTIVETK